MLWKLVFALAIIFVLTYDPNSRTLERFMVQPTATPGRECQPAHFEAVQFGKTSFACPPSANQSTGVIT